jgi:hypothetical protein
MSIDFQEWLDIIITEYLQEFISKGGAAVKFLIPMHDQQHHRCWQKIRDAAQKEGCLFVLLDSATTKTHMIDKLFHEVARQVNWEDCAYKFVKNLIKENGYEVSENRSDFNLQTLAIINEVKEIFFRRDINRWLQNRIYKDFKMSQEFRIAMIHLCLGELEPQTAKSFLCLSIKDWLKGDLKTISSLKEAQIFQKVGRHNSRHMFLSLARWLNIVGINGLVLCMDISRYMETIKPTDSTFYYTIPAVLDGYEVLRQFIDESDSLENCLITVIVPPGFVKDEKRGVARYPALKMRIWDEVHDIDRDNPFAPLVSVSSCS